MKVEFPRGKNERGDPDEEEPLQGSPDRWDAVADLCREHAISTATFYKWRSKYSGMDASMISEMKGIEDENRRLKKMFACFGLSKSVAVLGELIFVHHHSSGARNTPGRLSLLDCSDQPRRKPDVPWPW